MTMTLNEFLLMIGYLAAATAIPYIALNSIKKPPKKPKKYGESIRKKRMLRKPQ